MKKFMSQFLKASLLFTSIISYNAFAYSGSGIGGGVVFSRLEWCDEASVIMEQSRLDALERLSVYGQEKDALKVYYYGMIDAIKASEGLEVDPSTSLTLRAISRGIQLSQKIGVVDVISGQETIGSGLEGHQRIQSLLSFIDWYYLEAIKTSDKVDRAQYLSYSYDRRNQDIPDFSTAELEINLLDISTGLLRNLDKKFIKMKSSRDSYYSTIGVPSYLKALSFLSSEVSKDLQDSLFSDVYNCHSKKLSTLSRNIDFYLNGRTNQNLDALRLNRFTLELNGILNQINTKTCHL
jgi:hypothetical protein